MRYLVALGRLLYVLIFVVAGFGHFTGDERSYDAADSDGDVPEEYFRAGFGAFLRKRERAR